jgi:hypothetical protein
MAPLTLSPEVISNIVTKEANETVSTYLRNERKRFESHHLEMLGKRLLFYEKSGVGDNSPKHILERHLRNLVSVYSGDIKSEAESIITDIETYDLQECDKVIDISEVGHLGLTPNKHLVVDLIVDKPVFREDVYIMHEGKYYISSEIYNKLRALMDKIVSFESDNHMVEIRRKAAEALRYSRRSSLAKALLSLISMRRSVVLEEGIPSDLDYAANNANGRLFLSILMYGISEKYPYASIQSREESANKITKKYRNSFKDTMIRALQGS